eukprot:4706372-Prymnesium_polylepis.1
MCPAQCGRGGGHLLVALLALLLRLGIARPPLEDAPALQLQLLARGVRGEHVVAPRLRMQRQLLQLRLHPLDPPRLLEHGRRRRLGREAWHEARHGTKCLQRLRGLWRRRRAELRARR